MTVPWWIDAPSVVGFYGAYYAAFDVWLWRNGLDCRLGLVKVPDLNGSWDVDLTSSFDQGASVRAAQIRIAQRWQSISVRLDTDQSRSGSMIATLLTSDPNDYILNYEYQNTPNTSALDTMHVHRGSAEIRFEKPAVAIGSGEYYSGRDRTNQGTLKLRRSSR
jgi:hypothetical protein